MNRTKLANTALVILVAAGVAGCGGGGAENVASKGAPKEAASGEAAPTVTAPTPCGLEVSNTFPDGKEAPTTAPIPADTIEAGRQKRALEIVRKDPELAKALDSGANLVWAQPWYVQYDVTRGALLQFEFPRSVQLPTKYGIPARGKEGSESGDQYDEKGLPILVETKALNQYKEALSATVAVDLVDSRVYYVTASADHFYC